MSMVSREIHSQAVLLASCVGLGAWLMFCYDLLRTFRLIIPQKSWVISLEDLIYWIYVSLSAFSLLYRQNDGALRSYVVAGMFFGMAGNDRIIRQNVMRLMQKIMGRIKIKYNKRKHRQMIVHLKSGDRDENNGTALPPEKAGQMGEPDCPDRGYPGGGQPGSGGKLKKRILKRKGSGISDPGGEPSGPEGGGGEEEV